MYTVHISDSSSMKCLEAILEPPIRALSGLRYHMYRHRSIEYSVVVRDVVTVRASSNTDTILSHPHHEGLHCVFLNKKRNH
jgi:hypothetical protein